ncbi:MAG: bifunctional phosphoribosyl-AMP cyclohydrolase/phosphoribosyl-ATP diphosphatase HisIE [Spirochaetaceae bacterium]|nr:bifunctional phosphoribosyl-AMP cyclohydrolase/phosphoribosyl-ATP diphosphatase HisIE [Spirochaetaceae bacterium]
MIISSIDLQGGKVVQLKNGRDLVLEWDNPAELLAKFDRYGETAIIDLDAARGQLNGGGTTANTAILTSLLSRGSVRVGGGIRTVKQARHLVSLGAEKVIIGSQAFLAPSTGSGTEGSDSGGAIGAGLPAGQGVCEKKWLNTGFLQELNDAIGKQRVIIAVDAIRGNIAVKGWTETTGIPLIDGAREAEKYAGELLFTSVENEGCMHGTDLALVKRLRDAVSCSLTAAGGVASVEEAAELARWGVDVQMGMALYTGKVGLAEGFIACLNWEKTKLMPVIAQSNAGEVLMLGFANRETLAKTFATGRLTFWSRTRNRLWTKGETSGSFLEVVRLRADCDRDTVLATVIPHGPVCHRGSWNCFSSEGMEKSTLERLQGIIAERFAHPTVESYTATLDGVRVREKIAEEAAELAAAAEKRDVVWECADLLYFVSVLMYKEGIQWCDVLRELDRRHKEKG